MTGRAVCGETPSPLLSSDKMPRAGPSRSQRQFSQTQAQTQNPTQTHRYGRSQRRVEDEDEEEEIALDEDDEPGADDAGTVCDTTKSDW